MERYWKYAFIPGCVAGVVSAIPFVNFLNCCCLILIGGILWAILAYKKDNGFVGLGPGIVLGIITGAIAGFASSTLSAITWAFYGDWYLNIIMDMMKDFNLPEEAMQGTNLQGYTLFSAVSNFFSDIVVGAVAGLLLGLIWNKPPVTPASQQAPPTIPFTPVQ